VKVFLGRRLIGAHQPRAFSGEFEWKGFPDEETCGAVLRAEQGAGARKVVRMVPLGPGPVASVAWAKDIEVGGDKPRRVRPDSFICGFEAKHLAVGADAELLMMPLKEFKSGELGGLPASAYSSAFRISAYHRQRRVAVGNIVAPSVVLHSGPKISHTMYGEGFAELAAFDPCKGKPACPGVTELEPPGQFFDTKPVLRGKNRAAVDVDFRKGVVLNNATLWGAFSLYVTGDGPNGGLRGSGAVYAGGNLSVAGPLELRRNARGGVTLGVGSGALTIKGCGRC
jgi:hypothetical protein